MTSEEFQLAKRGQEGRGGIDGMQDELRRAKDQLSTLRRENKELKTALQATARDAANQSKRSMTQVETAVLQQKLHQLRRSHDDMRNANKDLSKEIERMQQSQEDLSREGQCVLDDEASPLSMKIRALENRLDKSLVKHNEAVAIRRTYETILQRLQEERVGFDNQLASIEKTLRVKEHDDAELQNMAHDAQHSKEMAKAELEEFKKALEAERRQKRRELEERKAYVSAKLEQAQRQERLLKQRRQQDEEAAAARQQPDDSTKQRQAASSMADVHTEEETRRMREHAESYRKIKEFTRAASKDEVVARWHELDETTDAFRQRKQQAQARVEQLAAQRAELQRRVDEAKYSGSAQLASRRIVDEFETHLDVARGNVTKDLTEFERTSKLFVAVKAGIAHLSQKLASYHPEMRAPAVDDAHADSILEVLRHCESKLGMLVGDLGDATDAEEILDAASNVELPPYNLRVATSAVEAESRDERPGRADAEDGEEDPHSREDLKQMAISAVERETKKKHKKKTRTTA